MFIDLTADQRTLRDELRDLGKVDIEKDLLPSLGGEAAFSSDLPLHVLFEEQARRTPLMRSWLCQE